MIDPLIGNMRWQFICLNERVPLEPPLPTAASTGPWSLSTQRVEQVVLGSVAASVRKCDECRAVLPCRGSGLIFPPAVSNYHAYSFLFHPGPMNYL